VAVELALVLPMFVSLVLVTVDVSRWVFGLAAAGEAAREGARSAAVCGPDADAAVRRRMAPWLEGVSGGSVSVQRLPSGCYANSASGYAGVRRACRWWSAATRCRAPRGCP
jgi:hypothetical protein